MHIESRVVNVAKIGLSYLTIVAAIAIGLKLLIQRMFYSTCVLVTALRCLLDIGLLATLKSYIKRSLPFLFNQRLISAKD